MLPRPPGVVPSDRGLNLLQYNYPKGAGRMGRKQKKVEKVDKVIKGGARKVR